MVGRRSLATTIFLAAFLAASAASARAQGIEIAPFAGYRFGGGFFEALTNQPIDRDGAPAVGLVFDVPLAEGSHLEGLFSHQFADISLAPAAGGTPVRTRVIVQHFQGGGLQEFGVDRIRPFLMGSLGLTHYSTGADSDVRFTVGAGGGVKLFPSSVVGVRLDGRVYATFLDFDVHAAACANGTCLTNVHTDVVWQAEFTAGLVFRLGAYRPAP